MMEVQLNDIRDRASITVINQTKEDIIDCAKNIMNNDSTFGISTLPALRDTLEELNDKYVDALRNLEACQKAFVSLTKKMEQEEEAAQANSGEYENLVDYKAIFNKAVSTEQKKLKNFGKDIEAELKKIIYSQEDEEIRVEAPTRQIPKDPITKTDIKVAVRSTTCNHIFDKESIEGYIAQKEAAKKNRVQCPQAGCINRNMKRSELVLDVETNELIQSL